MLGRDYAKHTICEDWGAIPGYRVRTSSRLQGSCHGINYMYTCHGHAYPDGAVTLSLLLKLMKPNTEKHQLGVLFPCIFVLV